MARILRDDDLRDLVSLPEAVACMEEGYRADARGEVVLLPRTRLESEKVSLASLGASVPSKGVLGYRTYLIGSEGGDRGHQLVAVYGHPDMTIRAVFLGQLVGHLRTGATLAAALRLTEPGVREVGFIGTGTQARNALACIAATSPLSRIMAWSPNPDHRKDFQVWSERVLRAPVELGSSASDVVRAFSTIVLTTATERLVISAEMVSEPKLFLSISAYRRPELAAPLLDAAPRIWTDSVAQATGPGTFFDSATRRKKLVPLGLGIADGSARDRSSNRIVINTGAAWEEVLLGQLLLERAESHGRGIELDIPIDRMGPASF